MTNRCFAVRASLRCTAAALLALGASAVGCGGPEVDVPVGSNTNWLMTCDDSAPCGSSGSCVCGTCSLECRIDADCGPVPGARCIGTGETGVRSQCRSETPPLTSGVCLAACQPGECGAGGACVGGACVVLARPETELCDALPEQSTSMLARQDGLLALIEELRATGVDCGDGVLSAPALELRWDPRLACTAHALAADVAFTRAQSLVDSSGRRTPERLALAGYSERGWGEAFALTPGDETAALEIMLADPSSCTPLVDAALVHIGVANVDDVYVVTVASE